MKFLLAPVISVFSVVFLVAPFFLVNPVFAIPISTTVVVTIAPNAPSNLSATANATTQVQLGWTANSSNEDGFSVERKTDVGGIYGQIATTGANVATYVDNSAVAATTYYYRVRAFAGSAYSSYSNEASTTTPFGGGGGGSGGGGSDGGGGGGGGGGFYIPPPAITTNVIITGAAYPLSKVVVLQDGQIAVQTIAGPDANFSVTINNLSGGNYIFSVYGEDGAGRRSTTFTFPVMITPGATTIISGIFLAPTIDVDKDEVRRGDTLAIFGQSMPNAPVKIQVNSTHPLFLNATSGPDGAYLYDLDTAMLDFGSHSVQVKAASGTLLSDNSIARAFMVGTENISAVAHNQCPPKGDLQGDCRVNLIDFSILAYWYHRPNPPPAYDLDGDGGQIDLVEFSIMAYYWTG